MRVLLATNDPVARRALKYLLRNWGYVVLGAGSGEEVWEVLNQPDPPELALMDWRLPRLDALGICARCRGREDGKYVYLILMGEPPPAQDAAQALEAGADDLLARPLEQVTLRLRLRAAEHILALQRNLLDSRQALEYKSTHDPLTGTWNRGEVLGLLERELARSIREGYPICILMVDVDYFKGINDNHGHLAGDAALREITRRMMGALRPYDIVGRYGGEEFLVVLSSCSARNAVSLAERLRESVASEPVQLGEREETITISIGVAAWQGHEHGDLQALIRAADAALYQAKREGRNRVEAA